LLAKVETATIIGTIQSTMTNFNFIGEEWKTNTEEERLLGVSLTGIYDNEVMSGRAGTDVLTSYLKSMHDHAGKVNAEWADKLGITPSTAITCVKPSGCQKESTLLITSEGVLTFGELGDTSGPQWQDHEILVRSSHGQPYSTKFYANGVSPTVVLTMRSGITLEATHNHRYQMWDGDSMVWVEASDVEEGTCLPYIVDRHTFGSIQPLSYATGAANSRTITQPATLTVDLAWLLGLYMGGGSLHKKGARISGSFKKEPSLRRAALIVKDVFDIDCILYERTNGNQNLDLYANSTDLVSWFKVNGFTKGTNTELSIPEIVRRSPAVVLEAFIDGLWCADGSYSARDLRTFSTVSRTLAEQLVVCLRATGVDAVMRLMPPTDSSWGTNMRYWVTEKKGRTGLISKSPDRDCFYALDRAGLSILTPDYVVAVGYGECATFDIEVPEGNEYLANTYVSHNTVSQLVDSASGIHPRHSKFYLRTVRLDKKDPLYRFMLDNGVYCEDADGRAETTAVFYFAVKAPKGAVTRSEVSAIDHLSLWALYQEHWCDHNPSITVTVRDDEWFTVGAWVYSNFDKVCGLAFLPYSDHVYTQAPFIELTEEEYDAWVAAHPEPSLDWCGLSKYEKEDQTIGSQTLACTGDSCSIL